jgi:AraC-like DNA-binding protein
MIKIDYRFENRQPAHTTQLETWRYSSGQFSFARLRSDQGQLLQPPTEPGDYVLYFALQPVESLKSVQEGAERALPPLDAHRICLLPGAPAALRLAQPFDLLRFHLHQPRSYRAPGLRCVAGRRDDVLRNLLGCFLSALDDPGAMSELLMSHIATAIDAHLNYAYGSVHAVAKRNGGKLAYWQEMRAKQILAASIDSEVPISEIATQCGLSPAYFATAFKRSTGVSPSAWLMRLRIDKARKLLQAGALPLQEVALACGFADQSHFTRNFSKIAGVSPGQWRMAHLAAA